LSLLPIDKGWNAQGVRSSYWRLYVNSRDGAAVVLDGGARHPIDPGRVHLIPAWVPFSCVNDRRVEHLYIHFDLAGLPGPLVRELFAAPVALATASPAHRLAGQLAEALRRNPPDDLATL